MTPRTLTLQISFAALALLGASLGTADAQTTWTAASGADLNWSDPFNWTNNIPSTSNPPIFNNNAVTPAGTINSIVDQNFNVNSLTFNNTGAAATNSEDLSIPTGITLTLGTAVASTTPVLIVGGQTTSATNTSVQMTGLGTLAVNQTADIVVANVAAGNTAVTTSTAALDMSTLSTFTATLGTGSLRVGSGRNSSSTLNLATSSTITAGQIAIGDSNTATSSANAGAAQNFANVSTLNLGQTTVLNADQFALGSALTNDFGTTSSLNNSSGRIQFQSGLTNATVKIRGSNGTSAVANMRIGNNALGSTSGSAVVIASTADFTGGSVDALVTTLGIGSARQSTGVDSSVSGTLSMNAGTFTVSGTSTLGSGTGSTGTNAGALGSGTLNVGGGTFNTGTFVLANNSNANSHNVNGTINVSGTGVVNVTAGSLAMGNTNAATGGTFTAMVNVTGGTLAFTGTAGAQIIGEALATSGPTATSNSALIASTVNLGGGEINVNGGTINVDTFNLQSGTLRNLGQFNSGGVTGVALTKTTAGTLIMAGTNAYTGTTTVNGGALFINGANTATGATAAFTVGNAGGTLTGQLGGTGSIAAPVTVNTGSAITGGTVGTVGMLSLSNAITANTTLTLAGGSTYLVDISGTTSDLLAITGALLSNAATISISGTLDGTTTYIIATYGSDTGSSFLQANIPNNYTLVDTGTMLELVPATVPEPSTVVCALVGGLALMQLRRRSRVRRATQSL